MTNWGEIALWLKDIYNEAYHLVISFNQSWIINSFRLLFLNFPVSLFFPSIVVRPLPLSRRASTPSTPPILIRITPGPTSPPPLSIPIPILISISISAPTSPPRMPLSISTRTPPPRMRLSLPLFTQRPSSRARFPAVSLQSPRAPLFIVGWAWFLLLELVLNGLELRLLLELGCLGRAWGFNKRTEEGRGGRESGALGSGYQIAVGIGGGKTEASFVPCRPFSFTSELIVVRRSFRFLHFWLRIWVLCLRMWWNARDYWESRLTANWREWRLTNQGGDSWVVAPFPTNLSILNLSELRDMKIFESQFKRRDDQIPKNYIFFPQKNLYILKHFLFFFLARGVENIQTELCS